MRVLAASFTNEVVAKHAQEVLNRRFEADGWFEAAALGRASDPRGPTTVLAGHFSEAVIVAVRGAVESLGGTVVVDVDERTTGSF